MMKALVIEDIKVITTAPEGINLVAVKVTTNDPSIYGVGCAVLLQSFKSTIR